MEGGGKGEVVGGMVGVGEMLGQGSGVGCNREGGGRLSMEMDEQEEVGKRVGEEIMKKNKGE